MQKTHFYGSPFLVQENSCFRKSEKFRHSLLALAVGDVARQVVDAAATPVGQAVGVLVNLVQQALAHHGAPLARVVDLLHLAHVAARWAVLRTARLLLGVDVAETWAILKGKTQAVTFSEISLNF